MTLKKHKFEKDLKIIIICRLFLIRTIQIKFLEVINTDQLTKYSKDSKSSKEN